MGKVPKCSSHQDASSDMQGSYLPIDLSRSKSISVDPACQEEHNGVQIIPLSYVVQKLMIKNFFPKTRNFDL